MKKVLLPIAAAVALATPTTASAQVYTTPVCDKYIKTCEISEAADLVVDTACHFMWPTLYRLGYTSCPV